MLKDYVLQFPEFREITVFNTDLRPIATSAIGKARLIRTRAGAAPARTKPTTRRCGSTTTRCRRPRSRCGCPTRSRTPAWVVGEISLEELWRMVDRIHVGKQGYALIVEDEAADRARQS